MLKLPPIRYVLIAPSIFLFILPVTHTTALRHLCLFISVVCLVLGWRCLVPVTWPGRFVRFAVLFWFAVCTLATFISSDFEYSWGEYRNEAVYPLLACVIFYALTKTTEIQQRWQKLLLLSCLFIGALCLASFFHYREFLRESLVGDRNAYSTYIVLIFPLLLLLATRPVQAPGFRRFWIYGAIVLAMVSGALTLNRNMWVGLALETVVFAALLLWRRQRDGALLPWRRYVLLLLAMLLVFSAIYVQVIHQKDEIRAQTHEVDVAGPINDPRLAIWAYAIEHIQQKPWLGYGYGRGIQRADFRTHFDNPLKWHGHNIVLDYGMEAGVPGMLAIVLLFAALYRECWRAYRSKNQWRFGAWGLTILIGITIKMMTDDILVRENSLLFWAMMGMIWAGSSQQQTVSHD